MAKLSNIQKEEIIKLIREDRKIKDIANRFQVQPATISNVVKQYVKFGPAIFSNEGKIKQEKINDSEAEIKKLKEEIKRDELIFEHQKKFKVFVEKTRKKKNTG